MENKRQRKPHNKAERTHELRDAYPAEPQAVGAQSFNKHTPEAVPCDVPEKNLAVKSFLLVDRIYDKKPDEVPEGFIKERGMCRHAGIPIILSDLHTEAVEEGPLLRHTAERLTVEEVAPSAEDLPYHDAGRYHVKNALPFYLLALADNVDRQGAADYRAVNGDAAAPYCDIVNKASVIVPCSVPDYVEQNIINTRTDNGKDNGIYRNIEKIVDSDSFLLRAVPCVHKSKNYAEGYDKTVPAHLDPAEDRHRKRYLVDSERLDPESGKRNCYHVDYPFICN